MGTKSTESFSVNLIVVHIDWEELNNHQFLCPASSSAGVLNEATIDLEILAALEQFKNQAIDRLLLTALEESGTTQKDVKKTPFKMLPSTLI